MQTQASRFVKGAVVQYAGVISSLTGRPLRDAGLAKIVRVRENDRFQNDADAREIVIRLADGTGLVVMPSEIALVPTAQLLPKV